MNKFIKKPIQSFFTISKFKPHRDLKRSLMRHFEYSNMESLHLTDKMYSDSISKLDWSQATNFERPWTKLLKPHLELHLNELFDCLGYDLCYMSELWFQQYHKNDTHGWHIHGSNFTGVYYVELPKNAPVTEFVIPYEQNKISQFDVEEGDILIFPSYVIHRAPPVINADRKTIVSFNLNLGRVKQTVLDELKNA